MWVHPELSMYLLGDVKCLCDLLGDSSLVLSGNVLLWGSSVIVNSLLYGATVCKWLGDQYLFPPVLSGFLC